MFSYKSNKKLMCFKNIVYDNIKIYNTIVLNDLIVQLRKDNLLKVFDKMWHSPKVQMVKQTLQDLFEILDKIDNKNIVFMACLNILFRRVIITEKLSCNIYEKFIMFTDIIKKCMMSVNKSFWNTWLPTGWNDYFYYGCLIVDDILYNNEQFTMHDSVNWSVIPNVETLLNMSFYKQRYPVDRLNENNYQLGQHSINISKIPNITNMKTITVPQINDKETINEQKKLDILSKLSFSNKKSLMVPQIKDKDIPKESKQLNTSHSTIQHLHAQAMLLVPTYKPINRLNTNTTTTNHAHMKFLQNSQQKNYSSNSQNQENNQFNFPYSNNDEICKSQNEDQHSSTKNIQEK